jgi:pyruvate dehydrogenase E2 component (dihydrolipoamide acetyltransferase)
MTDITMPQLSESMEEGTILRWLIEDGQPIARGEELVEIETDKATMTHSSEAEGVLEIAVAEGETVPVGTVIARALARGASSSAQADTTAEDSAQQAPPATTPNTDEAVQAPIHVEHSSANDRADAPTIPARISVTPLASRIALAHGLSLAKISGTGPGGRITRSDVLRAAGIDAPPARGKLTPTAPKAATAVRTPAAHGTAGDGGAKGATEVHELTRVQQVIARRMAETKATVPDFQVQTEVVMDDAVALRASLKAIAHDQPVPSFNDLIVKASALALRKHPRANGSYRDGHFELHERVNVGIAVAAEDALVVPTLTDADRKSLGQIAADSRRLAERVRDGTITPPELSGATFTVSNLGMFGMTAITPVINSPQAAILGVGMMRATLARVGEEIVDRSLLTLSLTCDHRILYGADAARLLADIKSLLETPLRLTL